MGVLGRPRGSSKAAVAFGARSRALRAALAVWSPDRSEPKAGRCRHHRCSACVHGRDDLLDVDALQVDARCAEVGMAELALDDVQRDTLAGELDGVRMTQLVGSEASPDTCLSGMAAKLGADGGRRPRSTAGRAVDHAEQWARRELEAL